MMPGQEVELESATAALGSLQSYVKKTGLERGFDDESAQDKFMLLVEEVGELAKAMRPLHYVKLADDSASTDLEDEAADILMLLASLCNKLGIDLKQAVLTKEIKNRQRSWK